MEVGLVQKIDIDHEMQQAYLDYAMSVIVARALPDARDGLKPVHRRILYAMYDMGLRPDSSYKKSARIVGEVLGKYHPHGDMAVYESMARMAQDFSMRYLLVNGQGNFGSVDGDPPAAMRYTEARLTSPAINMLADINKNTVDFEDNFDGTLTEPNVLPAAIPNLLVNGATGIAVGMSTSIPPHNLGEVVDALTHLLEHWEKMDDINLEDLMHFIQGPDFPTGGVIIQDEEGDGLINAYGTGRGRVTVQARAHLEEMERSRSRIIVTELPYMTNKSSLIERIASLVREERLDGITDLRDESDRQGMRIVIELSKTADPENVLRGLYKSTPMQSTFSIIMLALVDGEPRMLGLKQALRVYLEHRLEIVRRRTQFDLERARQRAHILEGLRIALQFLDEVITLIRKAPDVETARVRLMKRFKLTEIQAQAILEMQLRRLASLERKKIEDEYKEVKALIKELESLLRSPKKMRLAVSEELQAVKEAYGDPRRTQILRLKEGQSKVSLLTATDLTPEKIVWLAVTADGLISRTADDKLPRMSGREAPRWLVQANTRDTLYLVGEQGEAAAISTHALPETEKPTDGVPLSKVSPLRDGTKLADLFTLPAKGSRDGASANGEGSYILTVTRQGMVKKSELSELPGPAAGTFALVRVNEGDRLGWLRVSGGQSEVLLVTRQGMAIRFAEEEVRPMGLVAAGVMGIKLQPGDEVAGMELLPKPGEVFLAASNGTAKRTPINQFPRQGRYGQGVLAWKLPDKVQIIGLAVGKGTARVILHLSKAAPKVTRLDEAKLVSRTARGQTIQEVKAGDRVVALTVPVETVRRVSTPDVNGRPGDAIPESRASRAKPGSASNSSGKKLAAKPSAKPAAAKPASKPASKTAKATPKVTAKASTKPTAKTTAKPATKTTNKPVAKPTPKTTKAAPKAAAKTTKTTAKPAAKTTKAAPNAAAKTPPKPAAKPTAKTSPKPAAKPTAKTSPKPATKPSTKPAQGESKARKKGST